jgi:hypothetical protein
MHLSVGGTSPTAWQNRQNRPSRNRQTIKTEEVAHDQPEHHGGLPHHPI